MNTTVEFALDYLNILALMDLQNEKGGSKIGFAIARMFLIEWGLLIEDADTVNKIFWEKVDNSSFESMDIIRDRMVKRLDGDEKSKKRLLRQLASIACLDGELTNDEVNLFKFWIDAFDMKPSEASKIMKLGDDLAIALNFVGGTYIRKSSEKIAN